MYLDLFLKYCLAVFVAASGVVQLAAEHNKLNGVLFFRNKIWTYLFACVTVIPSLYYFFSWNERNATGVVEGAQQAGLFVVSLAAAILVTLLLSSLLNYRRFPDKKDPGTGIEALKSATLIQALRRHYGAPSED